MPSERPNHTMNITRYGTGAAGAKLAAYHLRKAFEPEKSDDEIWAAVNAQEWPEGSYTISSDFKEPYIKFNG